MSTDTRVLTGARWSEAVRCKARAIYQGLGTEPTNERPRWLEDAFDRGIPVGEMWGLVQGKRLEAQGHEVSLEHEVPWGLGWHGHADLVDLTDAIVDEAYHSKDLEFREEKALQNAGYVDLLDEITGREHRGVLTAINAADGDRNGGMALKRFPVEMDGPNGLRPRVREIRERVIAGVEAGAPTAEDKVSDSPRHEECQACVFLNLCHAGYQPPEPSEIIGLEDTFVALRVTDEDRKATAANLKRIEDRRKGLIETIEQYVQPGIPVTSGDVTIRRTHIAEGVSFSLTDALKAGHALPVELEAFAKTRKGYDKWEVNP